MAKTVCSPRMKRIPLKIAGVAISTSPDCKRGSKRGLVDCVLFPARLKSEFHDGRVPGLDRAGENCRRGFRTSIEQKLYHFGPILIYGPHYRREMIKHVLGIHIRAAIEQQFDHVHVAAIAGKKQRGRSVGGFRVYIGASIEQGLDLRGVALSRRGEQIVIQVLSESSCRQQRDRAPQKFASLTRRHHTILPA